MPVVARETDLTRCPAHAQGKIADGDGSVLVCFKPVARKGDKVLCKDGSIDVIIEGDATVMFGDKPVACKGHRTAHGGEILTGCPRVWIGQGIRGICKAKAAERRAAFIKYLTPKRASALRKKL
jgi:uncharacterized Zn-binding protein involved in type VI secretion